jgi:hypothetical protein
VPSQPYSYAALVYDTHCRARAKGARLAQLLTSMDLCDLRNGRQRFEFYHIKPLCAFLGMCALAAPAAIGLNSSF